MEGLPILNIIGGILIYLAKFLLIIASIVAFSKSRNTGSVLMLIGSLSIIIFDILGLFLITYAGKTGPEEVIKYTGINSIISAIAYIILSVGVLLFVMVKKKSSIRKS